jgi:pimeloyl-ACP methyl ester carboxylesterase
MAATFVLVHGGFHGGWCWRYVAEPLRAAGHRVTTPTLTGLGERRSTARELAGPDTWVQDLVDHLFFEDLTDVVLVGHSLSGPAITGVADRVPERLRRLVYLDSILVEGGERAVDTVPPEVAAQRQRLVDEEGDGFFWPATSLTAFGFPADHPRFAWAEERVTPTPYSTYTEPLTLAGPVGNGLPATYVSCTEPRLTSLDGARQRARDYGWDMREIASGHEAPLVDPELVVRVLMEVAG